MFHYDRGLFLTQAGLAVDVGRGQPLAFVSHAHADHLAPHQVTYCTPTTGALFRLRRGVRRVVRPVEFGEPWEMPARSGGTVRLTALPAGHTLGSAMLLAEQDGLRLLYSGDCRLGESLTSEPLAVVPADVLVLECTYGRPEYRLPPRDAVIEQFLDLVRAALAAERTPVVHGYALGRLQEVAAILHRAGIPTQQEAWVHEHSQIYRRAGVDLGPARLYDGTPRPGHVLLLPKRAQLRRPLAGLKATTTFILSGWAVDPGYARRERVDHALPLSDHCDYDELFTLVEKIGPKVVYCTHGPVEIVDDFRRAGINAHELATSGCFQPRLLTA